MAVSVKPNEIYAGQTLYVITAENGIEAYRIIKRRGNRFAICSEAGPIGGDYLGQFVHYITKFRTRKAAQRYLRLRGL